MTESQFYKKVFGTEYTMDEVKFKDGFINYIAIDSVNKYDRNINFSEGAMKNLLDGYDFLTTYQKLGYELSKEGKDWALVAYLVNDTPVIDYARVMSHKIVMNQLVDVTLATGRTQTKDGVECPIVIRFYINPNGSVIRTDAIINEQGTIINTGRKTTYPGTKIPVKLMFNNALETPDIPKEWHCFLDTAEHFVNSIKPEWEKSKINYFNNTIFNSENNAESIEKSMVQDGKSFHDVTDADGKISNALAPVSVGTSTVQQLETSIGYITQKVLEYSNQFRDHSGQTQTGTTTDIAIFNQRAFEYMTNKIAFRERQLQAFIDIVSQMTGIPSTKVTIQISEFEQWRLDILQAAADLQVAQAEQARGIATKNKAEAEAIANGSAQVADQGAVKTNLNIDGIQTAGN